MNKNIKYLVESILDDFYDDEQSDIIDDFLGYKYFPKTKFELREIIKEHYKDHNYNLNDIDVSQIKDLSFLFNHDEHTGYKDFDISKWDVSSGVDFSYMFYWCNNFVSDISKWDVSSGRNFQCMFFMCEKFNSDLSQWDVSSGKIFSYMFSFCSNFNSNLSEWDVSSGEKFSYMFSYCTKFNSDLSNWNISDYNYDVDGMFKECRSLNNKFIPKGISNYK